jgi:hypothetical protein
VVQQHQTEGARVSQNERSRWISSPPTPRHAARRSSNRHRAGRCSSVNASPCCKAQQ